MLTCDRIAWLAFAAAACILQPAYSADDTEPEPLEEVVVSGFRQSYANAVKAKREAVGVTDSISSEGLGRFPDLNVG